jgi:hypothetical protein
MPAKQLTYAAPADDVPAFGETQHSPSGAFGSRSLVGKYIVGATGEMPVSVSALPLLLALDTLEGIFWALTA